MLRIVRRHLRTCPLTSEADQNCPAKVKCPIQLKGVAPDGRKVRKALNTRNWTVAAQMLLEEEAAVKKEAPPVTVAAAVAEFRELKKERSVDTQRKTKLLTERLKDSLAKQGIHDVSE